MSRRLAGCVGKLPSSSRIRIAGEPAGSVGTGLGTGFSSARATLWRIAFAVLLLLAFPPGLLAQGTARDTLPIVRGLEIVGNKTFSDDSIRNAIATRASGCRSVFLAPLCWLGLDLFRRTERLDRRELRTDIARIRVFYFRRGYRWTQVDTLLERDSVFVDVTFQVEEGPAVRVRDLSVQGLDDVPDRRAILRGLPLREDEPFSELAVAAARDQIEKRLGDRGYPRAAVLLDAMIPRPDTLSADVTLRVEPGPRATIGEIEVQGASQLAESDVKRLLTFHPGEYYNESEIIRSQRQLYSMALFNYVDIQSELDETDSLMRVEVRIIEARMRGVQLGFGVSNTDCFQVQTGWTHRNLFGGTRRLELTAALSNLGTRWLASDFPCNLAGTKAAGDELQDAYNALNWRLRADFRQPWFLGTDNSLDVGLFNERQSLPDIYARYTYGGDVRLSREISLGTSIATTYRAGVDNVIEGSADFLFCANFGICDPDDIDQLGEARWLNWLNLTFARGRTDAVLSPTRGYRLTLEGETASRLTESEWAYYRAQGEVSWYQRLFAGSVLAIRLRGGFLRPLGLGIEDAEGLTGPITPPVKRHYAGGAYTVRGFAQNLLGPKVLLTDASDLEAKPDSTPPKPGCDPSGIDMGQSRWICDLSQFSFDSRIFSPRPIGGENSLVANAEVRVPLGREKWTGVLFVDFGRVWTKERVPTWNAVWTPGVGIRYRSPVGPLRLDVGYNPSGPEEAPVVAQLDPTGRNLLEVVVDEEGTPALFEYDPFEGSGLEDFLNRLQLHFSIGQAF